MSSMVSHFVEVRQAVGEAVGVVQRCVAPIGRMRVADYVVIYGQLCRAADLKAELLVPGRQPPRVCE